MPPRTDNSNQTLIFRSIPQGLPIPGKDLVVEDRPIPTEDGGVLVRINLASLDPHIRGQLRDPSISTYEPALPVGEPISSSVVGTVLKSQSARLPVGETVWIMRAPLAEYVAIPTSHVENDRMVVPIGGLVQKLGIDPGHWLGILGIPGLTGFAGLYEYGRPRSGETVYISSAAGTVGLVVAFCCKRDGLRVIGSVGSQEKVDFLRMTGLFDNVFNYRDNSESCTAALRRLAPQGIDIYFANVGGLQLQAAVDRMNVHGRVVLCNAIDEYHHSAKSLTWLWQPVIYKRLTFSGFLVTDLARKYFPSFQERMIEAVQHDALADMAPIHVVAGIENAAQAFVDLFQSRKIMGKLLVRLPTDSS
ncbi:NADP-dependent alkenal double bond reductase P1 [Colletotrichum chlorophyti]|uniref:NADP-dependent alkenal double bond reductase P1 n=1 Tax=Colletotrichum chlorophyti TaxID=708187 RepID=A0A1Q8S3Z3_9PEZI|nr:NADP-dependent alkenal double bond reductase P1 [Colletotrichum chlorophyti]